MATYDVVVVGAGPAGSAAARKCVDGGLKTLLIEKHKLPRRKACSGIIANVSQNYILENFGPIPEHVFGRPYHARGACFYFPSVGPVFADANCFAPYVWRDRFDHFLAKASGAELMDETRFDSLEEHADHLIVTLKSKKETVRVKARYLVGADGGRSRVIHSFAPDIYKGMPWTWACQKYYEGRIDADSRYLYWFLVKGMGPYPWLNIKDDQVIIGLAHVQGQKFNSLNGRFISYLKKNLGLEIRREIATEGCYANMMTPLNRFFPGRGRVLMVGDAMGLMHQGGEGISCALVSGGHAGEAIQRAVNNGLDPLPVYIRKVKPEMEIALDQFNPFRMMATVASDTSRQPGLLEGYTPSERVRMMKDVVDFMASEFKDFKTLLPEVVKNTLMRSIFGKYAIRYRA